MDSQGSVTLPSHWGDSRFTRVGHGAGMSAHTLDCELQNPSARQRGTGAMYPPELLADAAWTNPFAFAAVVDDAGVLLESAEDYRIAGRSDRSIGARAFSKLPVRARLIERQKRAFADFAQTVEEARKAGSTSAPAREEAGQPARVASSQVVRGQLEVILDCGGTLMRVCSVAADGQRPVQGAPAMVWVINPELTIVNIQSH